MEEFWVSYDIFMVGWGKRWAWARSQSGARGWAPNRRMAWTSAHYRIERKAYGATYTSILTTGERINMSNIPLYQRVTHLLLQSIYKDCWPSSKPILYTFSPQAIEKMWQQTLWASIQELLASMKSYWMVSLPLLLGYCAALQNFIVRSSWSHRY